MSGNRLFAPFFVKEVGAVEGGFGGALRGRGARAFDGHANCFIETGFGEALLIDFNYDTEPLLGTFPLAVAPMSLLKESRLNCSRRARRNSPRRSGAFPSRAAASDRPDERRPCHDHDTRQRTKRRPCRRQTGRANVFFTFFGMEAINKARHDHIKVATVGNPGLHLATWLGGFPGMASFVTKRMAKEIDALDIPPIPEFVEMIADSGARLYACKASVDMFHLTAADFIPQVSGVLTVGEFYQMAGGGQIIFT